MELFGSFYRRKLRRKQKRSELGRSDGALCKLPAETGVNSLISKVLRFTSRSSEPGSRPHSWHSTKLGEGPLDSDSMMQISQGAMGAPWHQSYHASASTTDLSGCDTGFLRKSPDQYSSRGSMESLDHSHPAYSSCNRLSVSKSSNSIDHLHSKRDSAYSSFSTSSSIPEYLAAGPSFSKERSYSMDSVPQHRTAEGMHQADIHYVRTVYDSQQGMSAEHEVLSAAALKANESKAQSRCGSMQGKVCHRSNSTSGSSSSSGSSGCGTVTSHRHSVGPVWGQTHNGNSYENLKGAPSPPLRSDSYAATRNHERPSSWSSLEQARSLRALHKGSWHHSSGSVASAKSSFGIEGQLHTVIEKSPESSPTIKPKQSLPPLPQPGSAMLPTGIYSVPLPEPHFAQIPATNPSSSSVYPALAKESKPIPQKEHCGGEDSSVKKTAENGYQSIASYSSSVQSLVYPQPKQPNQVKDDPQNKCGFYRSHFQTQGSKPPVMSIGQERKDPYTPVQPRREKPRYSHGMDIMESYRQPKEEELSRCQEQNVHPQPFYSSCEGFQKHLQPQGSDQTVNTSGRYHNESSTYQQRDQDLDHPLTRLENALAEVQLVCASPQGTTSHCNIQSERSMSVMEKVSHFERQQTKPRCHSHSLSNYSSSTCQASPSAKRSLSGLKDLQKGYVPQGRSCSNSHEGNTESSQDLQPRYVSTDQVQHRKPQDLHRSKSSFHLNEENGKDIHRSKSTFHLEENSKVIRWKENHQDILGTVPDTTFTRAYRDSIKDAQSKVLRSTSFQRRDLNINPPPVPVKHMSLDRKGTNMSPKPTTSPHTPKERHVIPVELPDKTNAPELPRVPPVGPPVMRICGRKRLTMEQKKLSYSEPENIHEVGASEQESGLFQRKAPPQFQLPETSVADRRRMFELVATRSAGIKLATSRPELKQMQQDALADYMERKTGRRMDGRHHRPRSAYMQSTSCLSVDSQSRTSTTSIGSLQEPGREGISDVNCLSFTLTANTQYPLNSNRNTQTQPQSEIYQSAFRPQSAEPQKPERQMKRTIPGHVPGPTLAHLPSAAANHSLDEVFERAVPARSSGKSASAEDLLDRSKGLPISHHFRSKSSPAVENHNLDVLAEDLRLFGSASKENRASASVTPEQRPSSEVGLEQSCLLNPGLNQLNPPVIRRERQRHSDRPRSHSASGLAASVGLPCPFSSSEWLNTNKTQCQPNLDAITFPGAAPENVTCSLSEMDSQNSAIANSSKDGPNDSEKTAHDLLPSHQVSESLTSVSFSPTHRPCHSGLPTSSKGSISPIRSLPSLRISESSIGFTSSAAVSQGDDEVFLSPTSPPLHPLSSREGNYPSSQPQTKEEALEPLEALVTVPQESQKLNSVSEHPSVTVAHQERDSQLHNLSSLSVTSEPNVTNVTAVITEAETEELSESPESPLLARREPTEAEVQVETLARELVSQDEALAPLLDIWASTTTLDLMEDIFPSCSSAPWHQRKNHSSHAGDSAQNAVYVAPEAHEKVIQGRMETDLDKEETSLNKKKVELLQALTVSVEALRMERERLTEEQQCYSALGCRLEALVQEHCKPNESEKYRMFIGDLDKIVNLLLSLSGRLARVENALNALQREPEKGSTEERASLQQKQRQLRSQQEDARELKENLDRRERIVFQFLSGYLSTKQLHDYRRYIRDKPALLIRQRHLDELIRQGEEQLCRLTENKNRELNPQTGSRSSSCSDSNSRPTTVTSL